MGCNCGNKRKFTLNRIKEIAIKYTKNTKESVIVYLNENDEYRFIPEKSYIGEKNKIIYKTNA